MKRTRSFLAGMLTMLVLASMLGTAIASNGSKMAELFYRDIKITVNGTAVDPKDANGNTVEPFIIDGTTYLPVRAVGSAIGLDVGWDADTSTVLLSSVINSEETFVIGTGNYVVGEDIPAGKYDCVALSGSGNFTGDVASLGVWGLNEILAEAGHSTFKNSDRYENLRLENGDTINIRGALEVEFIPN